MILGANISGPTYMEDFMVTLDDKIQTEEVGADPPLNGSNAVIGPTNPKSVMETTMGG